MPAPAWPKWMTAADIATAEAAGQFPYLLAAFANRAHWLSFTSTGDLRRPERIARVTRLNANPTRKAREVLRSRVSSTRGSIADAERKVAGARADLASPLSFHAYRSELVIQQQTARATERRAALVSQQTDLELFDLLHPM